MGTVRWRIAIVDDHERSRTALRAAIWAAGGEVAGEASRCVDALPLVKRAVPDLVIFAVGLPDGDGVEAAAHVIAAATRRSTSSTSPRATRSREKGAPASRAPICS